MKTNRAIKDVFSPFSNGYLTVFTSSKPKWKLDDVSVYHGTTQMIINGSFETGDFTGWTYSGSCSRNTEGRVRCDANSGHCYYDDECTGSSDRI